MTSSSSASLCPAGSRKLAMTALWQPACQTFEHSNLKWIHLLVKLRGVADILMTRELRVFSWPFSSCFKGRSTVLACLEWVSWGKSHYSQTKITVEVQTVYLIVILSRESMQKFSSAAFQKRVWLKKLEAAWLKTLLLKTAQQQRKLSFGQPLRKTRAGRKNTSRVLKCTFEIFFFNCTICKINI